MIRLGNVFQVQYARSAAMWQLLALILPKSGCWEPAGGRMMSMFWGDHQRFFKAMLMAAKVPALADEASKAIQNSHSVVIGLQSTGEANMQSEKEKQGAGYLRFVQSAVFCRPSCGRISLGNHMHHYVVLCAHIPHPINAVLRDLFHDTVEPLFTVAVPRYPTYTPPTANN